MVNDSVRLPVGIRDFAPGAAAARRFLAETLIGVFEQAGFAQVITPVFEYEDVLARGLGESARAAALRFVEPHSGQVLALRPDITPQIARLCATRYRNEKGPVRLCYEGPVFRYDPHARAQRELIQAGVELCGLPGVTAEAEVLGLAVDALARIGIEHPTIDLAHLGLAREILDALALPERLQARFRERIARRDRAAVTALLGEARGGAQVRAFAERLPSLSGGVEVIAAAVKEAPSARIRSALDELGQVATALRERRLPARLHIDLSEIRGFDYYTGLRFQAFAHGSAEPILGGGRYDELIGRYGIPRPAVGFALDVESAARALEASGRVAWRTRVHGGGTLVVGDAVMAAREAERLRAAGRRAAVYPNELSRADARTYAERWGYDKVVVVARESGRGRVGVRGHGRAADRTESLMHSKANAWKVRLMKRSRRNSPCQ